MHTPRIATIAILFGWPGLLVAGQQAQRVQVPINACSDFHCSAEESNSICSQSHQNDEVYAVPLVGIAANAVNLTSNTTISLTVVEEGRTIFANEPGLEAYERKLYAGIPSSLFDNDRDKLPATCALMLQYESQTLPLPDDSTRRGDVNYTTSCAGVIDDGCYDTLTDYIKSFDPGNDTATDCTALAEHVNGRIHSQYNLCTLYAGLVTVTGFPLYNTSANSRVLFPSDKCTPVLPVVNALYYVGDIHTIVKPEDRIGGEIFGGRQGFTPIITTVYDEGGNVSSVQFVCMQALRQGGSVLEDTSAASRSQGNSGLMLSIVTFVVIAFGMI